MADRYQNRPFPAADDYDRGDTQARAESDPLAELARLIGQNDPISAAAKAPHPLQSRANARPHYEPMEEDETAAPAGPPPWMQRARQEPPAPQEYEEPEYQPSPVHPLHRYATPLPAPAQDYHDEPQHAEPQYAEPQYAEPHYAESAEQAADPSRYDEALYGRIESGEHEYQRDPAYPDDPYAYQSEYEEEPEPPKRSRGMAKVAAVLVLAVVGTGGAYAYRNYVGSPRTGEPPIIKADNSPTKVVPAPTDGVAKTPDRMVPGDSGEKLVSREEAPVDVNSKAGPRIAYPALNQNGNPPPVASVTTAAPPPATTANGTIPNSEPRKIKTLAVKGDAENGGVPAGVAAPAAKPAPAVRTAAAHNNPASANASANGPLSLSPQGGAQPEPAATRTASVNPAPAAGGGYVVQVSSQRNEADAQASYRALQGKYPSVLGSQSLLVKRVDLGEKGVYYRAFAGPFSSADQATQVCNNLKAAGGPQCLIQRN